MLGYEYEPSKWQTKYHQLTHHEALGAGAAGPGKTVCLRNDAMTQVMIEHARCARDPRIAGARPDTFLWKLIEDNPLEWGESKGWALYLRRSRPMFEQEMTRAKEFFKRADPGLRWDGEHNIAIFSSGFRYQFDHCHNRHDYVRYDSSAYTHIAFDELIQFLQEQYERIKVRCRTDDPVLIHFQRVRAMSNPQLVQDAGSNYVIDNPNWVREYFVENAPEGFVTQRSSVLMDDGTEEVWRRIYLPAKLSDNPNKAYKRRYELQLRKSLPHIRKAMLEGDWFFSPTSHFAEVWDRNTHVIKPFSVPGHWGIFRSLDWGFQTPGCVHWHAIDPKTGDMYTTAEYTFKRKDAKAVANEIIRLETRWGLARNGKSLITGPADTQLWEDRGDTSPTKAAEMAKAGVRWRKANKRSRQRNAEHVGMRLMSVDEHGSTGPGLYIFNTCKKLHRTLPLIPTDPGDATVPKKGGEDHWYDSESYACNYAKSNKIVPITKARRYRADRDDDDEEQLQPTGTEGIGYFH